MKTIEARTGETSPYDVPPPTYPEPAQIEALLPPPPDPPEDTHGERDAAPSTHSRINDTLLGIFIPLCMVLGTYRGWNRTKFSIWTDAELAIYAGASISGISYFAARGFLAEFSWGNGSRRTKAYIPFGMMLFNAWLSMCMCWLVTITKDEWCSIPEGPRS